MDPNALYSALNTIAQCSAALVAFIGFLGMWRLERLRAELAQTEDYLRWLLRDHRPEAMTLPIEPLIAAAQGYADEDLNAVAAANVRAMRYSEPREQQKIAEILRRRTPLASEQRWLMCTLSVFLVVTLVFILVPAIVGLVHVDWLKTWAWTPWLIYVASALLAITSTYVVLTAARSSRGMLTLVLLLALASPTLAGSVRCTTYEVESLGRLQTLCDDGTRAVSTYNKTLDRWESLVTSPPGKTCIGQMNFKTRQWEGRCR